MYTTIFLPFFSQILQQKRCSSLTMHHSYAAAWLYVHIYVYFFPVVKECVPFVVSVKAMSTPYQSHLSLNGHFCKLDIALRQRIPKFRKRVTYS